jgi:outer membrane biosynthesis protein TonB
MEKADEEDKKEEGKNVNLEKQEEKDVKDVKQEENKVENDDDWQPVDQIDYKPVPQEEIKQEKPQLVQEEEKVKPESKPAESDEPNDGFNFAGLDDMDIMEDGLDDEDYDPGEYLDSFNNPSSKDSK